MKQSAIVQREIIPILDGINIEDYAPF
jgi:hypothetical protein